MEKGRWEPPGYTNGSAYGVLEWLGFSPPIAFSIVDKLVEANLLVRSDYYIPSVDELYQLYYKIESSYYKPLNFQWVMCGETFNALKRRHQTQKYQSMSMFSFANPPTVLPTEAKEVVTSYPEAKLFDIPIRIDPAARKPMIELVENGQ